MTKKEATEIIQKLIKDADLWDCTKEAEALRIAIEALQSETIPLSVADKIGEERERLQEKVAELQEKNADRPHGEWIKQNAELKISEYRCSECGHYQDEITNFCLNCGADMRGGGDK